MSIIKNIDMEEILAETAKPFTGTTNLPNIIVFNYIRSNQKKELDISAINGGNIIEIPSASFNINIKS